MMAAQCVICGVVWRVSQYHTIIVSVDTKGNVKRLLRWGSIQKRIKHLQTFSTGCYKICRDEKSCLMRLQMGVNDG